MILKGTQQLSDNRAEAIKNYLTKNNIAKERISTIGYGCSNMLYPAPKTEEESMLNRRVEILVVEY